MAQTKEERAFAAKRHRLNVLYRISPEEEQEVENFQAATPPYYILLERGNVEDSSPAKLFSDHDHISGLYRGRLAYLINKALGTIENSYKERTPDVLEALAQYLRFPPAVIVIGEHYGMIGRANINKKNKIYGSPSGPIKEQRKAKK